MLHALSASRPSRLLVALLASLLLFGAVSSGPVPAPASAQSLIEAPQTKEQADAAQKAADSAADKDDGGSIPLVVWLIVASLVVIAAAAYFILRDANVAAGPSDPRAPPRRPVDSTTVRGAPKTMFAGDGAPGGKVGRNKKREKSKRQKQARRNNR